MKTLSQHTVVIVGGGLAAGLIARQLARHGIDTLVLERGAGTGLAPEACTQLVAGALASYPTCKLR